MWAVGLGRPGLAAAPWGSLAHSGGREPQAWEESGIRLVLPVAASLGVTLSFWGPLQKGLRASYVPGAVVVAAGPSEQGHTVQCWILTARVQILLLLSDSRLAPANPHTFLGLQGKHDSSPTSSS